ncbi:hypothetical protein CDAR_479141 [Caerostris darwini]|uniref:Uncharacterized protein n=1 Tax=Caerostris darwini TaxID=1538125 RepID=A0AAV4UWY2_9ARAC|nr:hypothetical protein CDAR_479141 [Caerostris darwini]
MSELGESQSAVVIWKSIHQELDVEQRKMETCSAVFGGKQATFTRGSRPCPIYPTITPEALLKNKFGAKGRRMFKRRLRKIYS